MDDKIKYLAVVLIVITSFSGILYLQFNPESENEPISNNITDTDRQEISQFTGIDITGEKITLDVNELYGTHNDELGDLTSYTLINNNNGDINSMYKNQSESLIVKRNETGRNTRIYQNENFMYEKIGDSITGVTYNTNLNGESESIKYPEYVKSLISRSVVTDYTIRGSEIELRMDSDEYGTISEVLNVNDVLSYKMNITVTKQGIIEDVKINYMIIDNGKGSRSEIYRISDVEETTVNKPDWLQKAADEDPIYNITHSNNKITIENVAGTSLTPDTNITITGDFNGGQVTTNLQEGAFVGGEIYITNVTSSSINTTKNASVSGSIMSNIESIKISDGDRILYNQTI